MTRIDVQLVRDSKPWYENRDELAAFCRWMETNGRLPRDQWELVDLAHRYEEEHNEFLHEEEMERMAEEQEALKDRWAL